MSTTLKVSSSGGSYDATGYTSLLEGSGNNASAFFSNVASGTSLWMQGGGFSNYITPSNPTASSVFNLTLGLDANTVGSALPGQTLTNGIANESVSISGPIPIINISSLGTGGTGNNQITLSGSNYLAAPTININGDQNLSLQVDWNLGSHIKVNANDKAAVTISYSGDIYFTPGFVSSGATISGGGGLLTTSLSSNYVTFSNSISIDSVTSGTGGVNLTLGSGGAWDTTKTVVVKGINYYGAYGSGSETVDLTASAGAVDTISTTSSYTTSIFNSGTVAISNGTSGGIKGFKIAASSLADLLALPSNYYGPNVLVNHSTATHLSWLSDFTLANALDPSGALIKHLSSLQFTSSNGVITFSTIGSAQLSGFTSTELIKAAELIIDNISGVGNSSNAGIFQTGGNTYVVSGGGGSITQNNNTTTNTNSVIELLGVTGITGFGSTASGSSILTSGITNNVAPSLTNTGTAAAAVYNALGYSSLNETSVSLGTTSTTINGLAASGILSLSSAAFHAITTNQTGAAGTNSITINTNSSISSLTLNGTIDANSSISSLTLNGAWEAIINAGYGGIHNGPSATIITSLVDGTRSTATLKNLVIQGYGTTISSITDSVLTSIDATASYGTNTFGASATPLTNAGLNILLESGSGPLYGEGSGAQTVFANGNSTTITQSSGVNTGLLSISALGNNDVLSFATSGFQSRNITISGSGDSVTLNGGGAGNTYVGGALSASGGEHATAHTGANNIFKLAGYGSTDNIWVGSGNTVNIDSTFTGIANIKVAGDAYGTGAGLITANGLPAQIADYWSGATVTFDFTDAALTGGVKLAGSAPNATTMATTAHVNVAIATTLNSALNLAAAYSGTIAAHNGVIDWFQFGGNTYIVESENTTATAAAHSVLGAHDVVVKLTGLVDLTAAHFHAGIVTPVDAP